MSAEHFETILSCDLRTAADGRTVEYLPAGYGQPRGAGAGTWATCYLNAEMVLRVAAQTVRDDPMTGITDDHPARREQAARIIDAAARLVRVMALDAAYDGAVTDGVWAKALAGVTAAVGADMPDLEADR